MHRMHIKTKWIVEMILKTSSMFQPITINVKDDEKDYKETYYHYTELETIQKGSLKDIGTVAKMDVRIHHNNVPGLVDICIKDVFLNANGYLSFDEIMKGLETIIIYNGAKAHI